MNLEDHLKAITPPTDEYSEKFSFNFAAAIRSERGATLQGWPEFMSLAGAFPCVQMQEALADGVPRGLADAWIRSIETQPQAQAC